ncbi:DUF4811 domain-containing protein [Lactobacillus sp. UCMA15818]|uniref:DUF4811 domain-containing protein n=1 Tax=Lactobacillus sp. UCMA15818 TaxID=2583394 RepID=UPI0025AFCC15|nr:DUF4811 domain-containing protein [Lactobacillus sp. UCMA15818]MDN2453211.1 DUF4811 domain-containing protein [Lactobacillus sp. UCMA15818]
MIIFSLIICAILLFVSMINIDKALLRNVLSVIFALGLIVSMIFLIENDKRHFGMHKVENVKTSKLVSTASSKQINLLLYQTVGTSGKEKVYIYKAKSSQKKATTTNPDPANTQNKVRKTSGSAKLVTRTLRWEYKSNSYKFWFGILGNGHKLIRHYNTFKINDTWAVLSTQQAKKLQKLAKNEDQTKVQAQAKAYIKAQVKEKLTAAMTKDPTMSTQEQQALTAKASLQAQKDFKKQALQELISEAKR